MSNIAKIVNKKLLVSKKGIAAVLGVSPRQIENYQLRSTPLMRDDDNSSTAGTFFELWDSLEWYKNNIDYERLESTKTKRLVEVLSGKQVHKEAEAQETDISKITETEAKRRNEIAKLKHAEIKIEKELEVLIPAEDVDRALAEQAVLHKTDKVNDEKILPVILENKSVDEIAKLLYAHNMESLKRYDKLMKKEFKCKETFYDIIQAGIAALDEGEDPEEIIKRIKG